MTHIDTRLDVELIQDGQQIIGVAMQRRVSEDAEVLGVGRPRTHHVIQNHTVILLQVRHYMLPHGLIRAESVTKYHDLFPPANNVYIVRIQKRRKWVIRQIFHLLTTARAASWNTSTLLFQTSVSNSKAFKLSCSWSSSAPIYQKTSSKQFPIQEDTFISSNRPFRLYIYVRITLARVFKKLVFGVFGVDIYTYTYIPKPRVLRKLQTLSSISSSSAYPVGPSRSTLNLNFPYANMKWFVSQWEN